MFRTISFILCVFLFASCTNEEQEPTILKQPPFDKLSDSIKLFPDSSRFLYVRGQLLYRSNEKALAEKDIRAAWQLTPTEDIALSLNTVLREKHPDTAIHFLEGAIKILPQSVALPVALVKQYQEKKQWDKALPLCNQIIARYPNQLDALILKAQVLKELDRDAEALATLEQAYSFAPDDAELVHMLAFEYAEAKNAKALGLADSLIKVDLANNHAEPYYIKGVYFSNTGKPAEAIHQFDEAIRHNFNFMDAYINKGIVYYEQKNYDQALKTFNLAATVSPDLAEPYYWLAKTLEAVGNKADAKLNYQRAYGLNKDLTEAKVAAERL